MIEPKDGTPPAMDPRVGLAAERTLLAWVRTGLALMGFGFVVARFGLFLHEIAATRPASISRHVTLLLAAIGVVMTAYLFFGSH